MYSYCLKYFQGEDRFIVMFTTALYSSNIQNIENNCALSLLKDGPLVQRFQRNYQLTGAECNQFLFPQASVDCQ